MRRQTVKRNAQLTSAALRAARHQRGFTLIEIMIVVVIIGILSAMIIPNVVGRDYEAQVSVVKNDLRSLGASLDLYRLDNFQYPTSDQGLEALITKPTGFPEPKNWKKYLQKSSLPKDPWGNEYVYENYDDSFELYSVGADGAEGGESRARDIRYDEE